MTTSTDGILVYGIHLQDREWGDEDLLDAYGWPGEEPQWTWLRENVPVDFSYHCCAEYVMTVLTIRGAEYIAPRGSPLVITPAMLQIKPQWNKQIKEACERLGVTYVEPQWWLQSWWG